MWAFGGHGGIDGGGVLRHLNRESGRVGVLQAAELGLILCLKLLRQVESGGDIVFRGSIKCGLIVNVIACGLERAYGLRNVGGVSAFSACTKPLRAAKALFAVGLPLESCWSKRSCAVMEIWNVTPEGPAICSVDCCGVTN